MEKVLSVIIPSYNMENYLEKCVGSLTASSRLSDIEVVIVNDGSKDGTAALAARLAENCPSVSVINKENGGHGSAVNAGVAAVTGKYFMVLDSDDWVDTEQFDLLVGALAKYDADCAVCDYVKVFEATGGEEYIKMTDGVPLGTPIPFPLYVKRYDIRLHSVSYRTELYRAVSRPLTEKCYFDDAQYSLYPYGALRSVLPLPYAVYRYRLQRAGQSVSPQGFLKHLDDHRRVMDELISFYDGFTGPADIKSALARDIGNNIGFAYGYIAKYGTKQQVRELKPTDAELKKTRPEIYAAVAQGRGARLLRFLHFGCFPLLRLVRKCIPDK